MAKKKKIIIVWSRSVSLVLAAYRTYMQQMGFQQKMRIRAAKAYSRTQHKHIERPAEYVVKKEQMKVQPIARSRGKVYLHWLSVYSYFLIVAAVSRVGSLFVFGYSVNIIARGELTHDTQYVCGHHV